MTFISNSIAGEAGSLVKSVGSIAEEFASSPEDKLQHELELKKAEYEFQTTMQHLSNEEKKLYLDDVSNARQMATEIQTSANASSLNKNISAYLALGTTFATFTLFALLFIWGDKIEDTKKDIVIYILGVLSAIVTQIFSFYFGSSQGSADKGKVIEQALSKKTS